MEYSFYEEIALEASNFSTIKKTIVEKLKKALLTIIKILRKLTKTNKDKGIRHKIDTLLSKAEKKLSTVDKIETPQEAEQVKTEVNAMSNEVEQIKEEISYLDKPEVVPGSFKKIDNPGNNPIVIKNNDKSEDVKNKKDNNKKEPGISKNIKECVDKKDKKGLVYIFVDSLDVDPTFIKYKDDYYYSLKEFPEWMDNHKDLTPFESDKSKWNTRYWERLKLDFQKNPSKERFNHMRQVAKVVYADKITRLLKERTSRK